jgi:hypothetical protein
MAKSVRARTADNQAALVRFPATPTISVEMVALFCNPVSACGHEVCRSLARCLNSENCHIALSKEFARAYLILEAATP